jgi:hypothetical protein
MLVALCAQSVVPASTSAWVAPWSESCQHFNEAVKMPTLIREQLVDEYRLMVHPIVFGTGKRLFRDATTFSRLELIDSAATSKGVPLLRYRPSNG